MCNPYGPGSAQYHRFSDTPPYPVQREVEDVAALVDQVGGTAYLYGISSGRVLALEAASRLLTVTKLAMYEPPFIIDDSRPPPAGSRPRF